MWCNLSFTGLEKQPGAKREVEEAERLGLKILDEDDIKIRRTLNQICEDNSSLVKGQMDCKEILRIAPLYVTVFWKLCYNIMK